MTLGFVEGHGPVALAGQPCLAGVGFGSWSSGRRSLTRIALRPLIRFFFEWGSLGSLSFSESTVGYRNTKVNSIFDITCVFRNSTPQRGMNAAQSRAARGLLKWTQADLARASSVSEVTIRNFENEKSSPTRASLTVIRAALEAAGVIFQAEGELVDGGPGVRLKGG